MAYDTNYLSNDARLAFEILPGSCYFTSRIPLFLFFILRLENVFKRSIHRLSKKLIVTVTVLLCIDLICILSILYPLYVLFTNNEKANKNIFDEINISYVAWYSIASAGFSIIDLLLSSTVCYLFVSRLFKLVLAQKSDGLQFNTKGLGGNGNINTNSNCLTSPSFNPSSLQLGHVAQASIDTLSINSTDSTTDTNTKISNNDVSVFLTQREEMLRYVNSASINFSDNQTLMISLITRYTVLSVTAMSWNVFNWIVTIAWIANDNLFENNGYTVFVHIIHSVVEIIEIGCLYLNFGFAKHWYIMFCNGYDKCCQSMCHNVAQRSIKKQMTTEIENRYVPL